MKKPRKRRSDIGKKRERYAGKKCKHMNRPIFQKKKGDKTHIKIWIWKIDKMSYDGYKRFNKKIRRKIRTEVWIPLKGHVHLVPVSEINNKEKLGDWVAQRYYEGTWGVKTFTHKKNKFHCTAKKKAIVVIKETEEGNIVRSFKDFGMYRYWFWNK